MRGRSGGWAGTAGSVGYYENQPQHTTREAPRLALSRCGRGVFRYAN